MEGMAALGKALPRTPVSGSVRELLSESCCERSVRVFFFSLFSHGGVHVHPLLLVLLLYLLLRSQRPLESFALHESTVHQMVRCPPEVK